MLGFSFVDDGFVLSDRRYKTYTSIYVLKGLTINIIDLYLDN